MRKLTDHIVSGVIVGLLAITALADTAKWPNAEIEWRKLTSKMARMERDYFQAIAKQRQLENDVKPLQVEIDKAKAGLCDSDAVLNEKMLMEQDEIICVKNSTEKKTDVKK